MELRVTAFVARNGHFAIGSFAYPCLAKLLRLSVTPRTKQSPISLTLIP